MRITGTPVYRERRQRLEMGLSTLWNQQLEHLEKVKEPPARCALWDTLGTGLAHAPDSAGSHGRSLLFHWLETQVFTRKFNMLLVTNRLKKESKEEKLI